MSAWLLFIAGYYDIDITAFCNDIDLYNHLKKIDTENIIDLFE